MFVRNKNIFIFLHLLFISLPVFSQSNLLGKYEYSYSTDVSDGVYTIEFLKNNRFYYKTTSNEMCSLTDIDSTCGFFKIKKDTVILISPIPINHFNASYRTDISSNEFIYLMKRPDKRFYPDVKQYLSSLPDLKDYINSFNFYFLDSNLNKIKTYPVEQKVITNSLLDTAINTELYFKFNIPSTALYFTSSSKAWLNNTDVTFAVNDIQGKSVKTIEEQRNTINKSEDYFDVTLEKYLINRRKTKLLLLDKESNKPKKRIKYKKIGY